MSSPFVSLHVVVTHPASAARPTLQSLRAQTHTSFQVVLIDNASQDNASPWQHGEGPDLMVLRNFRDQGFARAHNQALTSLFARWSQESLATRWVALLSDRVVLAPDCVAQVFQAIQTNAETTVLSPKVRVAHLDGQEDTDEPRFVDTGIIEEAGRVFSRTFALRSRGRGERDQGQYDQPSKEVLAGTWCLFVRADALLRANKGTGWLDVSRPESCAFADLVSRLYVLGEPMGYVPEALAWVHRSHLVRPGWVERFRRWYGEQLPCGWRGILSVWRAKRARQLASRTPRG